MQKSGFSVTNEEAGVDGTLGERNGESSTPSDLEPSKENVLRYRRQRGKKSATEMMLLQMRQLWRSFES